MNKKISLVVLLLSALLVTVGFSMIYFSMIKPTSFEVLPNTYSVEIYTDSGLTTVATSISFPSVMASVPSEQTVTTQTYYLTAENLVEGESIICRYWILGVENLTEGWLIGGNINIDGQGYAENFAYEIAFGEVWEISFDLNVPANVETGNTHLDCVSFKWQTEG